MPEADEPTGPPVFVGGMQRSGTSMVRAMLGSSPDLAMYDHDWPLLSELCDAFGGPIADRPTRHRKMLLAEVLFHPKALRSPSMRACIGTLAKQTMDGDIETYDDLARQALEMFRTERGRSRVGLKEPGLERHLVHLDRIFGDYHFIQLVRDPLASFVSAEAYGIALSPESWAGDWRSSIEAGEAQVGDRYLMVRYEDIVTDRETWAKRFAEFCGLSWSDEITTGSAQPGWAGRNSSFQRDGDRPVVPPDVVARIVAVAGDALDRWGYTPESVGEPPRDLPARVALVRAEQQVLGWRRRGRRLLASRVGPK